MIQIATIDSPLGALTLASRQGRVCLLHFGDVDRAARQALHRWYPGEPVETAGDPAGAVSSLRAYFDGSLNALDSVPVELNGTPFQKRVWEALRGVRPGTTAAYADIARLIRAPSAIRAVGAANGANPVAVIVPCHRIVGTNGSLTGYGGGLPLKQWLLEHEGLRLRL
jgi:methylated-DNA-[protein]-cysteine S-methyltransferase